MASKAAEEILRDLDAQGQLTPEMVVRMAEDENSPLHEYFLWDHEKAAHMYRIDQARTLIRSVRVNVVYETTTIRTIAYVHDPETKDSQYTGIVKLRTERERALQVLDAELGRIASGLTRARVVAQGLDLTLDLERRLMELVTG